MSEQDRLGPPPVEPMSDVAWARVEKDLMSRLDRGEADAPPAPAKRPRWPWLAVPALAVAAVLAILIGAGAFTSRDSTPALSSGDPAEPSRVVAGEAPTSVSFGDAHIDLAAQSAIVMSREAGSPSVLLERGAATFAIAPRANRRPFVVRAGDTVVRVVGTRFTVARRDELITVAVAHGLVDVQFRGATQSVGAGETWTSATPAKTAVVPDPREAAEFDRLTALEARDPESALAGYLALSAGSTRWSAVALYAAGRLAAEREDPRAATILGTYLRRFPGGANAVDARDLLDRLNGATP